ncbi:MAG TPA: hypothetical protein VMS65_02465, partial [Polyangiaceae bacterium]|nr:hypothetical protein [Polyangiaceae bacterium]
MPLKSFLVLLGMALVLPLGCSEKAPDGGGAGMTGDDLFFVPEGLTNTEPNGEGGLTLIALTLLQGATSAELYAAVRNDGETPACNAGMTTNFLGKAGELVGSSGTTLQSGDLYQFTDGSGAIIPCVAPGEIAMAASTELPETIVIADLGSLEHQFPAFTVDGIVPIDGLRVGAVETVKRGAQSAYTGTFTNGLEVT